MHLSTRRIRNIKVHFMPFAIITALFLAAIIFLSFYYVKTAQDYQYYSAQSTLEEVTASSNKSWTQYVDDQFQLLNGVSGTLDPKESIDIWNEQLHSWKTQIDLSLGFSKEDGSYSLPWGNGQLSKTDLASLKAGTPIYDVIPRLEDDQTQSFWLLFCVPLPSSFGSYAGIYEIVPIEKLNDLFFVTSEQRQVQLYLTDSDGVLINSFYPKTISFTAGSDYSEDVLRQKMSTRKAFFYSFSNSPNNNTQYAYYAPVLAGKWYFIATSSSSYLNRFLIPLNDIFWEVLGGFLFALFLYFISIFFMSHRLKNYQSKNEQRLVLSQQGYKIIAGEGDSDVYEYDISNHTIAHTVNYRKILGFDPISKNFPQSPVIQGIIHPDDIKKFLALFNAERKFQSDEIRIKGADGVYIWCRITAHTMYDNVGFPLLIMGRITDITEEKVLTSELVQKARIDSLTAAYNKITTHELITLALKKSKSSSLHAIFLIDIDNFKTINDQYGHMTGDFLLSEIGAGLQSVFRKNDIIGRIGGDEFMVFLKEVPSEELISQKAQDILNTFAQIRLPSNPNHIISGSIGISMYPRHGQTYEELYKRADEAMYYSKKGGKSSYTIYQGNRVH